jgi:hypothetical protein
VRRPCKFGEVADQLAPADLCPGGTHQRREPSRRTSRRPSPPA